MNLMVAWLQGGPDPESKENFHKEWEHVCQYPILWPAPGPSIWHGSVHEGK